MSYEYSENQEANIFTPPTSTHEIKGMETISLQWGGVQIISPKRTFIGEGVIFDTNYPQDIFIEEGVRLTSGVKIVTHFMNPNTGSYDRGKVHICKGAYLGMNTLVVKPVTIGERAIIGAGSVVTKDIPANEVWAGNPAKFIRKR